ncbi:hypothetical protein DM02DRAFT_346196 [Periconia macrospinosa]|uniref:SH3 domain-containing protein n=1 Tax=Periconia macrospinosa TaxID=97972 RepID=A0A2V1DTS2_9PLEO|nr:hypothetical protein DM02DRAFT_346196 [Periconia macrospinosa]
MLTNFGSLTDTLDLQDKSSPTAADHSQHPHPAPLGIGPAAPHQEASLRRVEDERSGEEEALQNGWKAANGSRDNPESEGEPAATQDDKEGDSAAVRLNGGMSGESDDAEMEDADVDEDLDDLDRISSSPSISDGGCFLPSYSTWSERRISPNPRSTPISSSPVESAQECDSSSPYVDTPIHFPLAPPAARRSNGVPAGGVDPKFPYCQSPTPFSYKSPKNKTQSADHHQGEYTWPTTTSGPTNNAPEGNCNTSPRSKHLIAVEQRLQGLRLDSDISLLSEIDDAAVQAMLQPVPSPVSGTLNDSPSQDSIDNGSSRASNALDTEVCKRPNSPLSETGSSSDDNDSWITDSDADSWDDDMDHDDDSNDNSFSKDPRYVDSGWEGICLQDTEDIDFDFVYALHTFVATVEGQANATKGDTMVLLDDSNSYWWLVRVVKDSSIGYLPAEHIETPTERLARLNKHRNIDLSATMLGDTADKPKNPLKKAMRRRHAKTVTWGDNSVVEASDYDYSSDEGGDDELFGGADPTQTQAQQQQAQGEKAEAEQDDNLKVQPLKVNGAKNDGKSKEDAESKESTENAANSDESKNSEEVDDRPLDPKVSRNGTVRNTDSFFKDENTETRKITLTPNLLRDDSSTSTTGSRERGPSLESLEKTGFADKVKDDKKKKEKKPGMLSGLFKRKDKKTKGGPDAHDSDNEKQSEEFGRDSPQSKESEELTRTSSEQSIQRQASKGKLQKSQRSREESPSKTKGILKTESPEPSQVQAPVVAKEPSNDKPVGQPTSTMRLVSPEQDDTSKTAPQENNKTAEIRSRSNSAASKLNPINILKTQQPAEPKPEKVKKAKKRVQLDDFDSEEEGKNNPFADPDKQTQAAKPSEPESSGRLSESPVHVSAADAQAPSKGTEKDQESDSQHPPGLTGDTSSQETNSPISTPTPDDAPSTTAQPNKSGLSAVQTAASPAPGQQPSTSGPPPSRPAPLPQKGIDTSPPDSSETTSLPAWSDQSLRNYLEDGSDIRDMLLVIKDTTGVIPVGNDHPIMSQLFVEETKTVSGLSNELDSLLNGLLEKRMRKASKSASPSPIAAKSSR